jgi:uncharacterized protein YjbI with pentapeptide repeats
MANPKHLQILKQGVEEWNQWRSMHRDITPDLYRADLTRAKLTNVNFWRADLRQVNLSKAHLHGTILHEADLQGANLTDATGLLPRQLAGADVSDARLPANFPLFTALDHVKELSDSAQKVFLSLLVGCVYCWLTIATTTDARLLTDSASSPLPIVQTPISIVSFFWIAPWILFFVYWYLLLYLQRLWEGLAELPAIFPDGRTLPQRASSWLLNGLVSAHRFRLREKRPAFMRVQTFVAGFLIWWIIPLTLLGLWVRAFPRHEYGITIVQLVIFSLALWWEFWCYLEARATLKGHGGEKPWYRHGLMACGGVIVPGLMLFLYLYFSLITPPRCTTEDNFSFRSFIHSVEDVLLYWGTANIKDADMSTKPPNWTGMKEEEFPLVKGARLAYKNLTCARASRAFLLNAEMNGAQLACADLSEAWLQRASLPIADLRGAAIHGAKLSHANLQSANLQGARLTRAVLQRATLQHADLQGADLQGADLQGADLQGAKLQSASLWGANLAGADLVLAKLAGADLQGANLASADLQGANLAGTDLQQVRGLTQDQLKMSCGDKTTKLPDGLTLPFECPDLPPCFDPPCPDPPPLPPVPCPVSPSH